jgi:hypothetical protein
MITEKDLLHRAKVFLNNCGGNNEKISFGESLKVILLSELLDRKPDRYGNIVQFTPGELDLIFKLIKDKKPWYKFW